MNLFGRLNPIGLVVALLLAVGVPTFASVAPMDSFEPPLKRKVVDFGPSPSYEGKRVRVKLSCYFYATFMVKEYDTGQEGAEWLAIVPTKKEVAPACVRSHAPGERIIEGAEWSGYFKGAKGNLVFFDADDGANGGLQFVVYDSRTGTKIFEDSAYDSRMGNRKVENLHFNRLRGSSTQGGQLSLRYLRVVEADCDLHREKASCWEQVRKKFELKSVEMPVCSRYKGIPTRVVSAVAYPVEVFLFPRPAIKAIAGPVKCWPVD
jgi:hypothetical protein